MKGRKPTPTHLKMIRGTARKDRMPKSEPKPQGELLVAPDYLNERQKLIWTRIVSASAPGLLRRCDEAIVAAMAMHLDAARQANSQLSMTSLLESRRAADAPNSLLRIRRQELEQARACAARLGFDPASRSRIELQPEGEATDEWAEFFD